MWYEKCKLENTIAFEMTSCLWNKVIFYQVHTILYLLVQKFTFDPLWLQLIINVWMHHFKISWRSNTTLIKMYRKISDFKIELDWKKLWCAWPVLLCKNATWLKMRYQFCQASNVFSVIFTIHQYLGFMAGMKGEKSS